MNKYKIMILVVLMTTLVAGFATAQDQDIKVSILANVNYQFDVSGFEQLTSEFAGTIEDISQVQGAQDALDLLSGFNLGLAFQMLFGLSDIFALGFEIGADVPIASLIAATSIQPLQSTSDQLEQASDIILPGLIILPRAVFGFGGLNDFLTIDLLAGLRFGFNSLARDLNNLVASSGGTLAFTFGVDLGARLNLQFSEHFGLYVGANYILPFDVLITDVGVGLVQERRPDNLPEYAGKLAPTIGARFSF